MDPLKKFLIQFKKRGSENITHTIIPGSKSNITEINVRISNESFSYPLISYLYLMYQNFLAVHGGVF